ncbi:MAG: ATP-binding protein [Pseudomonadota bacterium]
MATPPFLHLFCGKIGSGKSTLAAEIARQDDTVLISEDAWLSALFADQMSTPADYVDCAAKLRAIMAPHIVDLLKAGISVALDFPANTLQTRRWARDILDAVQASHVLHVLDAPDALCLERLKIRNAKGEHPFAVTEIQFHLITQHYEPPSPEEGFTMKRHNALT